MTRYTIEESPRNEIFRIKHNGEVVAVLELKKETIICHSDDFYSVN